jgi:hypothetical protein
LCRTINAKRTRREGNNKKEGKRKNAIEKRNIDRNKNYDRSIRIMRWEDWVTLQKVHMTLLCMYRNWLPGGGGTRSRPAISWRMATSRLPASITVRMASSASIHEEHIAANLSLPQTLMCRMSNKYSNNFELLSYQSRSGLVLYAIPYKQVRCGGWRLSRRGICLLRRRLIVFFATFDPMRNLPLQLFNHSS